MDIIWLLFCHWIADFICQTSSMARGKHEDNVILAHHCLVYGFVIGLMSLNPLLGLFAGLIHFPVDYVTSRLNKSFWDKGEMSSFFISLGFDQFIHCATLILLYAKV